jgi:hypothetical protein
MIERVRQWKQTNPRKPGYINRTRYSSKLLRLQALAQIGFIERLGIGCTLARGSYTIAELSIAYV